MMVSVYRALWHIILSHLIPVFCLRCSLHVSELGGMTQPGDIMIGVVLPLHVDKIIEPIKFHERPPNVKCTDFLFESFQSLQALRFAVEEINGNPNILANITLGYQAHDSCDVVRMDLQGVFQVLSGYDKVIPNFRCLQDVPFSSVIGPSSSTQSILVAHILGLYRYPQISYLSTSNLLSDRTKFNSFFRTVPSDNFQSQGLAQLVLHFGWTWVGLLATDDDYGQHGIQLVKHELVKGGACVAFSENIPMSDPDSKAQHIVKVMKGSSAVAVVVFSDHVHFVPILVEIVRQNITDKIFVASEAWSTSTAVVFENFSDLLSGTIGLAFQSQSIPGLGEFLNIIHPSEYLGSDWVKVFWEIAFGCRFVAEINLTRPFEDFIKDCTGTESLNDIHNSYNDVSSLRSTYSIYMAVHVIAKSLENMNNCKLGEGPFPFGKCADIKSFKPWQAPVSVCSQSCPPGYRKAVRRGEPACCFQCVPCPQGEISNQTDSTNCFKCPWDMWPNQQKSTCLPKPVEYLSYENPLGATMAATSIASSLVPVVILRIFIRYKTTPIVKANNYSVSCILLVSLSLCFICTLAFIGYPEPKKCLLRQPAFGMVFTFCISCILAKTIIVVFAFMATKPGSSFRLWTSPWVSYIVIATCSTLQLLLSITWLSLKPPFPEQNILTKPGVISVECNEGSTFAFWSMFGYLGLLATISFILAFLARGLPDNFNEAKFITFSMLSFLSVWVSYIPASLSARGKYTQAMEVFAILASSWALVISMFLPKCFIIIFRPNMNLKGHLMKKEQG